MPARSLKPFPIAGLRHAAYLLATGLLAVVLAFVNKYPLVYSDSGTYILSSFTLEPAADRPIGYGLIIRAVTWQSTLWTVVLFQGVVFSWLLWEVMRGLFPEDRVLWRRHLAVVAALVLLSSMPWYAAQVMPDFLTPLIVLILYLLFLARPRSLWRTTFLWTCLFFFLTAHNAHVAMAGLILAGLPLTRRHWPEGRSFPWRTWIGSVGVLVGAILFVAGYNGLHGLPARFSPASNVFLTGRLCEWHIVQDFLAEHCAAKDYALCSFREELPLVAGDLIWPDNSLAKRLGPDLVAADSALAPMVQDIIQEPDLMARALCQGLIATVVQVFQVNTNSGLVAEGMDSAPWWAIHGRLPAEEGAFLNSYQAQGRWWDLTVVDRVVRWVLLVSVLVLIYTWRMPGVPDRLRVLAWMVLAWVVLNAAVTGALANVYDRLQSRVAWLVVLLALLFLQSIPWGRRLFGGLTRPSEDR